MTGGRWMADNRQRDTSASSVTRDARATIIRQAIRVVLQDSAVMLTVTNLASSLAED